MNITITKSKWKGDVLIPLKAIADIQDFDIYVLYEGGEPYVEAMAFASSRVEGPLILKDNTLYLKLDQLQWYDIGSGHCLSSLHEILKASGAKIELVHIWEDGEIEKVSFADGKYQSKTLDMLDI